MHLAVRYLRKDHLAEVYISTIPDKTRNIAARAAELFETVATELAREKMFILQERIFCAAGVLDTVKGIREKACDDLADAVESAWLEASAGIHGELVGVRMHGVTGVDAPEIVGIDGVPRGSIVKTDDVSPDSLECQYRR